MIVSKVPKSLKPILKCLGGKTYLVPRLKQFELRPSRWVSAFAGGLGDVLGLMPERSLINDINSHVINLYRWVQKGLVVDMPLVYDRDLYYQYRDRFNQLIREKNADSQEAAVLLYYLNRCTFNGLMRFSQRKQEFNSPFGRYSSVNFAQDFLEYQPIFAQWEFTCGDFEQLQLQPTDTVYADPPYSPLTKTANFTQYSGDRFTWDDQVRLARWLSSLPGDAIASNHATPEIIELYTSLGFDIQLLDAPRRISCKGDRGPVKEMLAVKKGELTP